MGETTTQNQYSMRGKKQTSVTFYNTSYTLLHIQLYRTKRKVFKSAVNENLKQTQDSEIWNGVINNITFIPKLLE